MARRRNTSEGADYADLLQPPKPPAPPKDNSLELAQIKAFLQNRCFHCEKLNATITRESCAERQRPKPVYRSAYAPKYNDNPYDAWCTSGKCSQGSENLTVLGITSWDTGTNSPVTRATTTRPDSPSPKLSSSGSRKSSRRRKSSSNPPQG